MRDAEQAEDTCKRCNRSQRYCVCDYTTPLQTRIGILILQHPQEPGVDIGTVPIIAQTFPDAVIRTGLSWPNLKKALGREAMPQRWGVLYLGSVRIENLHMEQQLIAVDRKGAPLAEQDAVLKSLEGIVLLDGTWSQAKTLWWRNAWLLKLRRLVINSKKRSIYDMIRKEPRKGCLSTVETAGEVLSILEHRSDILPALEIPLRELVGRLRSKATPRQRA
jgi:DTW domain-containing protein YfiP